MDRVDDFDKDGPLGEFDELSFGDSVAIDKKLLAAFKKTARELGVSKKAAQRLADMYAGHIAESVRESDADWGKQQRAWESEIENRPGFNRELEEARKLLREYSNSEELFPLLNQSLLGSHPAFFDFLVNVSEAMGMGSSSSGSGGSGQRAAAAREKTLADRMWPSMG